jgi:hypothetical protein
MQPLKKYSIPPLVPIQQEKTAEEIRRKEKKPRIPSTTLVHPI